MLKIEFKKPWKVINTKGPKLVCIIKSLNVAMSYNDLIWNISHVTIAQMGSTRVALRSYTYIQKDSYLWFESENYFHCLDKDSFKGHIAKAIEALIKNVLTGPMKVKSVFRLLNVNSNLRKYVIFKRNFTPAFAFFLNIGC